MSRRDYPTADRYEERQSDFYRKPRGERNYQELDVDIQESRYDGPARSRYDGPSRRAETVVKEKDVEIDRRTDRGPRQPDFLREDYGKSSNAGELVIREKREEDDYVSRAPTRRRSFESARSRGPARTERVEKEEISFKERDSGPRRSERVNFEEEEKTVYRERSRSRPPAGRGDRSEEKIDIRIREDERSDRRRTDFKETDVEEIRFRRGGGDRPPPRREEIEREEITIRERDREPYRPRETTREEIDINIRERDRESYRPRETTREEIDINIREKDRGPYRPRETTREEIDIDIREKERGGRRGRETEEEIDIDITRDRSAQPQRSLSRGALVRKDREEWIVRRRRTPSPSPPPARDYEKEEIIIRRKERTPSPEPEPPREPTPEPLPPPIYRPPIIQEVITHHRHIDHGVERARSPTPPPPSPPSPPKEDNLEVSIRRTGTRNGKAFEEDITFETDRIEGGRKEDRREVVREEDTRESFRELDIDRTRSVSNTRRRYDDDVVAEADYYNRKAASRGYPGEAWNGATRDWGLVDIPPGTERVRMDGMGGGRQEISWDRYNGERRGHFYTGDRVYESEYGNGFQPAGPPLPPPERTRETRFTETRINEESRSGRTRDKTWTEVTKDLVLEEAIKEQGYEYEESDGYFYVMEYLRYEDVLKLVEITEDIRRERRDRLREIQWEREEIDRGPKMLPPPPPPVPAPPRRGYDERIYEREYDYHRDGRRYR